MKNRRFETIVATVIMVFIITMVFIFSKDKDLQKEVVEKVTDTVADMATREMTEEEVKELPTTEIVEQTEEQEKEVSEEQEVESEAFEEQGEIAYNGTTEYPNVSLGNYKGLTYYSQIDGRWNSHSYTSINNYSQTIGTSGCGPTCASMVVTATKGTITPPEMGDLFVKYGYRSADNGTYFSAFRFVADTFNIGYQETYRLDDAVNLLRNNHYVVVSCANGLFTTGGHFILLTGINGDTISIYDPYLYAGKFETSTRRGKVSVNGNTVYCSIDNFRNYANYQKFFAYEHDGNVAINNTQTVNTSAYTRYVTARIGLNIRRSPNGTIIGSYKYGTAITILETSGNWSRTNLGWVSSNYLGSYVSNAISTQTQNTIGITKKLTRASILYSNSNLTGYKYNYRANTTITILQNINANVDRVRVNQTGRIAYINNNNYTNVVISQSKSTTVGQYKRFKNATTLYSSANLSGTRYTYLPSTQVKIIKNVTANVDYVYVVKTKRYAYVNSNSYK